MSLGLILGGVAKGYQQGEDIKDQRVKRKATEQKLDADQAEFQRLQDQRAGQAAIGQAGTTMVPANLDYDPAQSVQDAIAARHANDVPQNKPGLLGILSSKLRPKDAAIGAGVTPVNDPMQNPLGLASGTPVGATALPVGAPQRPEPNAALGVQDDSGATVTAPAHKVPMSDEQVAAQYAALMRKTGTPEQAQAAGKAYFDLHNNNTIKAINSASPENLEIMIGDATGHPIQIDPAAKGGFTVKDKAGNVVANATNLDDLRARARMMVDNNPGEAFSAFHQTTADHRASVLADATIRSEATRASAAATEATAALQNAATGSKRQAVEEKATNVELEKADAAKQAATELASNPDMAITDPERFNALAETQNWALGKVNESTARKQDAAGNSVTYPVNRTADAGMRKVQAFQSDPYVATGGVRVVPTKDGKKAFVVFRGGAPAAAFSNSSEALAAARRILPAPKLPKGAANAPN